METDKHFDSLLVDPEGMPRVDYLKARKDYYQGKINDINRVLELLEKNPPLAELNDLLRRI